MVGIWVFFDIGKMVVALGSAAAGTLSREKEGGGLLKWGKEIGQHRFYDDFQYLEIPFQKKPQNDCIWLLVTAHNHSKQKKKGVKGGHETPLLMVFLQVPNKVPQRTNERKNHMPGLTKREVGLRHRCEP